MVPPVDPGSFAFRLKSLREARRLSKQALASMAGTTTVSIWDWESGRRRPQEAHLERLAGALGVPAESLRGENLPEHCPLCGAPAG